MTVPYVPAGKAPASEVRPKGGEHQPPAEVRLQQLEQFVKDYTLARRRSIHFAELARKITDLLADDMSAEEKSSCWLLICYAKRQQHAAELREQPDG